MITFIDWLSPPCITCLTAFGLLLSRCRMRMFMFSVMSLMISPQTLLCIRKKGGAFTAQLMSYALCFSHRQSKIILLTYDPIFAPILQLFCPHLHVFEHNTVPEVWQRKHYLWQRLFFHRINRLAQSPGQLTVLKKMGQKSRYIGSPLKEAPSCERETKTERRNIFVPAARLSESDFQKFLKVGTNKNLVIKKESLSNTLYKECKKSCDTIEVEWFDMDYIEATACSFIISYASKTRVSGWFNQAIRLKLIPIILNPETASLFEATFPDYPHIGLDMFHSRDELDEQLSSLRGLLKNDYALISTRNYLRDFRMPSRLTNQAKPDCTITSLDCTFFQNRP